MQSVLEHEIKMIEKLLKYVLELTKNILTSECITSMTCGITHCCRTNKIQTIYVFLLSILL